MKHLHPGFMCLIFATLLRPNVGYSANTTAPKSIWESILAVLNVSPEPSPVTSLHLSDDLLALNAHELKELEDTWRLAAAKRTKGSSKEENKLKNEFFHTHLSEKNHASFVSFTPAAAAGKNYRVLAAKILNDVHTNAIANLESVQKFDQGSQIGFCFGRAMLVHYLLLKAGVPQSDIAKIFLVGQLMVAQQNWSFHVAVMVKDAAAGYLVIDPLEKEPVDYLKWVDVNAQYEIKAPLSRARFYVTDPRKFLPSFGPYSRGLLEEPALKEYFTKLAGTLN